MELYFWAFVVALLIFAVGGGVSVYEGMRRLHDPETIEAPLVNFAVLGASILVEGFSFRVAWQEHKTRYPDVPPWTAIQASKDPSVFAVLLEDAAARAGLFVALLGVTLAYTFDAPVFDGLASIAIGGVLVLTAVLLARETLSLMTGESASVEILDTTQDVISGDPRVREIQELLSLQLGPRNILLAISIDFRDDLSGTEIELAVRELTDALISAQPSITRVFLRPIRRGDASIAA